MNYKFLGSAVITAATGLLMSSLGFVFASPARADIYLCNKAASKYLAAVTWNSTSGMKSRGWIQIEPGECKQALKADTSNMEFGVYGENIKGGSHTGDIPRCVIQFPTQPSWNIVGADDASRCKGKGRVMVNFRRVRTGSGSDSSYELFD